jgi:choline kinase
MTRAIILAAGQGTRLRPLTNDRPKVMVELEEKSILERQVELFRNLGITDITVVTGYFSESVKCKYPIRIIKNEKYQSTNMVYSLFCAKMWLEGDVIISYGDIIYDRSVLEAVLLNDHDISVATDLEWEPYYKARFNDAYLDAESLVFDDKHHIASIGKEGPSRLEVMAQYIGLIKLSSRGSKDFQRILDQMAINNPLIGWGRFFRNAYMTDFLQEFVYSGGVISAVPIRRGWYEIDTLQDYNLAVSRLV